MSEKAFGVMLCGATDRETASRISSENGNGPFRLGLQRPCHWTTLRRHCDTYEKMVLLKATTRLLVNYGVVMMEVLSRRKFDWSELYSTLVHRTMCWKVCYTSTPEGPQLELCGGHPNPDSMISLTAALVVTVETLYGCLFLTAALCYSCFQKEFWRARTKEEDLALQQGKTATMNACPSRYRVILTLPSLSRTLVFARQ